MRGDMEREPGRNRSDDPGSGHEDFRRTGPRPEPSRRAKAIGGGILDAGVAQRIVAAIRSMPREPARSAPLSGADLATLDAVTERLKLRDLANTMGTRPSLQRYRLSTLCIRPDTIAPGLSAAHGIKPD